MRDPFIDMIIEMIAISLIVLICIVCIGYTRAILAMIV
jgi:hypothetical protein